MSAAILLHVSNTLRELVQMHPEDLKQKKSSFLPTIKDEDLSQFLALMVMHIGLEKKNVPVPPPLNFNDFNSNLIASDTYEQDKSSSYETPTYHNNNLNFNANNDDDDYLYRINKKPRYNRDGLDSNTSNMIMKPPYFTDGQLTTPNNNNNNRSNSNTNSKSSSPFIRPAFHHLGVPDSNTNLSYEIADQDSHSGDQGKGFKQTRLVFKKK
jgi:hypothetical protein